MSLPTQPSSPRGRRACWRLLTVATAAVAVIGGLTVLAPRALAAPAAASLALPAFCQSTAADADVYGAGGPGSVGFTGTGTISCLDLASGKTLTGASVFSGVINGVECTGAETSGSYRDTVTWSDGTVTTGTFTNLDIESIDGLEHLKITGTTDATSTRYPGYSVTIDGSDYNNCGSLGVETGGTQTAIVSYLPPL
jgi:hypothetical protein